MIDKVIAELLKLLKGADLVIALIALALIAGYLYWVFASKAKRKKIKTLPLFCLIIAVLAGVAMVVCHLIVRSANTFAEGTTGVLVLRIVGDDNNSLQRDLVSSLNDELMKAGMATNIRVRASDEQLDDTKLGVSVAHQKARGIGHQLNAQIVVWGNRAGEKKFWPRIRFGR